MRTSRRSFLATSAATAALLSVGQRRVVAQEPPIRIGVIYDHSGPFAAGGSVACSVGTQIAIDLVNEKGGVAGKYKVEPVNADSQSKAEVAINEVERLINQEKVDIVNGVYASAHAVPLAAKIDAQKKILWITTAVSTAVFKDKNLTRVFRAQIHSDQYGEAFAGFLADNAKAKLGTEAKSVKVAIIHEDGPYGVGVADASERFAKDKGLQLVLKEGYSATAPDLSSLVTKLKRAGPDVISHVGYNPDITLFLRQARESGLRFKMLVGNGAGYSQLDKLRATFGKDVDDFCGAGATARREVARPRAGRSDQDHGRALQGENWRHRRAAALLDGLQPDLGAAQQCAAGRQAEIRRLWSRGRAPGCARRGHPGRRHHSGLWREILPARYAAIRSERALHTCGHAELGRAHLGGLAD
jgi:branched-chain amino acid transport system substrate-binding protein